MVITTHHHRLKKFADRIRILHHKKCVFGAESREIGADLYHRMVRSELVRKIADANPLRESEEVEAAVAVIFTEIENALAGRNRVELRGFGVFVTRPRCAHMGRNPKNGTPLSIPARQVPWFRASNLLLDKINA